jgi:hypothetical protein
MSRLTQLLERAATSKGIEDKVAVVSAVLSDPDALDVQEQEETFTPPDAVASAARRGLRLRDKVKAGTAVGVRRANQLANKEQVSLSVIGRMVSYFARHGAQKPADVGTDAEPTPWLVAWLLWGGDPGREWANKVWKRAQECVEDQVADIFEEHRRDLLKQPDLREAFAFTNSDGDLREAMSLDPSVYIAAYEAELSHSDVVNRNLRLYPRAVFEQAVKALAERAEREAVGAVKGHPSPWEADNAGGFDVVGRWFDIKMRENADGSLTATGVLALLNSALGQQINANIRAGFRIGTSTRAPGKLTAHRMEASSPYYKFGNNRFLDGFDVDVVEEWGLGQSGTIDVVCVPSASTYLHTSNHAEKRENTSMYTQEQMTEAVAKAVAEAATKLAAAEAQLAEAQASADEAQKAAAEAQSKLAAIEAQAQVEEATSKALAENADISGSLRALIEQVKPSTPEAVVTLVEGVKAAFKAQGFPVRAPASVANPDTSSKTNTAAKSSVLGEALALATGAKE